MTYKRFALLAALAVLASCGSDSTSPIDINNGTVAGSVSFNFTGAGGGTYTANGAVSVATLSGSTPFATLWAVGFRDTTDNSTNIAANIPRSGNASDLAFISVKGQSTGTFNIIPTCVQTVTVACTQVGLIAGQSANGAIYSYDCFWTSGSVTIASISSTNATGSFSGSGTCFTSTGSSSTWIVTNGAFNVPLVTGVPNSIP